jgi:hypothetical protein
MTATRSRATASLAAAFFPEKRTAPANVDSAQEIATGEGQAPETVIKARLRRRSRDRPSAIRAGTLLRRVALNVATGEVLTRCTARHRAQHFVAFLRHLDASVEPALDIHVRAHLYQRVEHLEIGGESGSPKPRFRESPMNKAVVRTTRTKSAI